MKYTIGTIIKKGQVRDTSEQEILQWLAEELKMQNVRQVELLEDRLSFSIPTFRFPTNRYFNKFMSFSSGTFTVTLKGNEYLILLEGNIKRIFAHSAMLLALFGAASMIGSGFRFHSGMISTWLLLFPVIVVIRLVAHYLTFPVYFTKMHNQLQNALKSPLN